MKASITKGRWRTLALGALLTLALGLTLAACGSSDDDSTGSDTGSTTETTESGGGEFTGEPVKIYFDGPLKTPIADATDALAAAEAGALALNEAGGLAGHEVQIVSCNETSANAEVSCARKAAADKALAFVGSGFFFNAAAPNKILEGAKIPNVGALAVTPEEFSTPINYAVDVPSLGVLACPQLMAESNGAKKLAGIAQDLPVQVEVLKTIEALAAANKLDYSGSVTVSPTETDFSGAANEVTESGAESVVNFLTPTAQGGFFTAASSLGKSFSTCASPAGFTNEVLTQLGTKADEIYVASGLPPISAAAEIPLVQEFVDQTNAAAESGVAGAGVDNLIVPANALRAWLGLKVIEEVAPAVKGELTSANLVKALDESTVDLTGIATLDFAKPGPGPGLERMFNPNVTLVKWDSGAGDFVTTEAKPANMLEVFAALAP